MIKSTANSSTLLHMALLLSVTLIGLGCAEEQRKDTQEATAEETSSDHADNQNTKTNRPEFLRVGAADDLSVAVNGDISPGMNLKEDSGFGIAGGGLLSSSGVEEIHAHEVKDHVDGNDCNHDCEHQKCSDCCPICPPGPRGPQGPPGTPGPAGAAGATGPQAHSQQAR